MWAALSAGIIFIACFLVLFVVWVNLEFGPTRWEQVWFHLYAPLSTLRVASGGQTVGFFLQIVVPSALLTAIWVVSQASVFRKKPKNSFAFESVTLTSAVTITALVLGFGIQGLEGPSKFRATNPIGSFYVEPSFIPSTAEHRPNLIWIYLESIEDTYSNEEIFGRNLLSDLESVTSSWTRIPQLVQTPGAEWTMGGMVASQCGLPLVRPADEGIPILSTLGRNELGVLDEFLPRAVCLGDVLSASGYRNVYLGGASSAFAGKGKFLSQHGFSTLLAKEDWEALEDPRMSSWGLHDDALFAYARSTLTELRAAGEPFVLMMLTLDTHSPSGHANSTCVAQGASELAGRIECSSQLVSNFIEYLEEIGALEDSVVVVVGDHLAPRNDLWSQLQDAPERTIFARIHVPPPGGGVEVSTTGPTFLYDLFPTVLSALGFQSDYPGAALGRDLFREPSLAQRLGKSDYSSLATRSAVLDSLWQLDLSQFVYELGHPIQFTAGGNARLFAGQGFSGSEETHTWIEGTEARLSLLVAERLDRDVTISIAGWPFSWPDSPQNKLEIRVNGRSIGTFPTGASPIFATVPVELIAIIEDDDSSLLEIELIADFAEAPCLVSESSDCRKLSFAVQEITVR